MAWMDSSRLTGAASWIDWAPSTPSWRRACPCLLGSQVSDLAACLIGPPTAGREEDETCMRWSEPEESSIASPRAM